MRYSTMPFIVLPAALLQGVAVADDRVNLAALSEPALEESRAGLLRLRCRTDDPGVVYVSRAVLLQTEAVSGRGDILLASRHAVEKDGERLSCSVAGENARRGEIVRLYLPSEQNRDVNSFIDDWALLESARRLSRDDQGLRAAILPNPEELTTVSMPSVREAEGRCNVIDDPMVEGYDVLIAHDCSTWPGSSGAPLVVDYAGEPYVVGLHVGQMIELGSDRGWIGIARLIDDEMRLAFEHMLVDTDRDN